MKKWSGKSVWRRSMAVILFAALLHAQSKPSQYEVKAAYLYNFGKYVSWPAKSAERFNICVLGTDPFGETLDSLVEGERLTGKPVVVRRLQSPQDVASCHVVYVGTSDEERMSAVVAAATRENVLTVSDVARFLDRGGMIQFVNEGDRIRFSVNLARAQRAGLSLSSELLKVAKEVKREERGGGR